MENHLSVFAFVFAVIVIALFQKLAALLLRRVRLSWKNSFIFGTIVAIIKSASYLLINWFAIELDQIFSFFFGLFIAAIIGGWFFRLRVKKITGEYIDWIGGVQLAALGYLLVILTAMVTGFQRFS